MKLFLLFITGGVALASCRQNESPLQGKWIDLTHPFDEQTIYWPTSEPFRLDTVFEGVTEKGFYYSAFKYCAAEHGGTHLDAPVHFARGKNSVEQIPVEQLAGEAVVIDVSEKALKDRDYQVSVNDFLNWEKTNGQIPDDAIVLLRTGYGQYWTDKIKYIGTGERGQDAVAKLHFPGLHPGAARWLAGNRKIKAIGLDTPSIDYGQSTLFESHQILFEHNIPAFENVAHLDKLPVKGAFVIALPMKIRGGSGAPLRMVAVVK
ncbi:MAG TPA: cyclase family protein [Chitinophagales bacterium]|nr:cyclase family protein [Chitinophagales bacterium]